MVSSSPPAYPANDLYERDYRTPWKSITLYQFFLKGFAAAAAAAAADSLETPRGILLSKRSSFYSRVLEGVICSNTSLCFGSLDLCKDIALLLRCVIRFFAT